MNDNAKSHSKPDDALPAVILAAGEGNRLQKGNHGIPKPLTTLLGLTLLERAVLSCHQVGVQEFYVVTGCYEKEFIPQIKKLERRLGISIQVVHNPNWREGNGTSALAVSPYLTGPFLLVMCDDLFDPDILRCLMDAKDRANVCLLAVDRRTDRIFDLKEATKVRLNGQAITAIGKGLTPFDAVDTGLFLCQPFMFQALEKARFDGDGSLSAGVGRLVGDNKIRAVEIGNRIWLDVDTPESLSLAKSYLLAELSKPSDDGYVSRYINRPLSRRVSMLLAHTPLTPNAITFLSFLLCLSGAFLFSLGEYIWTLLAGLLTQLSSVVDGCDGEIARLKFRSSRFGAWLDTVLDRYADVAVAVGISYGYWLTHPHPLVWLAGVMALTGFLLSSYTKKEYALRYQHKHPGGVLNLLGKRDVRLFALFVGALLNRPFEALVLVGFFSHIVVAWSFLSIFPQRWHKT